MDTAGAPGPDPTARGWGAVAHLPARVVACDQAQRWAEAGLPDELADLDVPLGAVWAGVQPALRGRRPAGPGHRARVEPRDRRADHRGHHRAAPPEPGPMIGNKETVETGPRDDTVAHAGGGAPEQFARLCAAVTARPPFGLSGVVPSTFVGFAAINGFHLLHGPADPHRVLRSHHDHRANGACLTGDLAVRTNPVREEDGEIVVDV
jgi:hypothetical protein